VNLSVVFVNFQLLEYSVLYLSPAIQNYIGLCIVTCISDVISKAVKEAGRPMFVLAYSRQSSTGRSLLLLSISSLLHVQTTVRPLILAYRLSGCLVFIAFCSAPYR